MRTGRWLVSTALGGLIVLLVASGSTAAQEAVGEWRSFGADPANTKYSPLDQIRAENFTDLEVAWRWTSLSVEVVKQREEIQPQLFKGTPLMAGGLVYISTALGQVAALNAGTGEQVWAYDPRSYDRLVKPANIRGAAATAPRESRLGGRG